MHDEVEEDSVDALLAECLREERRLTPETFERDARVALLRLVNGARNGRLASFHDLNSALPLLERLLAVTANQPGLLARVLGYRDAPNDAEHRAMMRALETLHNDPLPEGSAGGRAPAGRGHRVASSTNQCILCKARPSAKGEWRTDCPKNPPRRVRSKRTCAVAVAEAAAKARMRGTNGQSIDSDALLKMYDRWQREGSPRERESERLLKRTPK